MIAKRPSGPHRPRGLRPMTSVPLSDEQADRIEAGERPGAIGAPADLVEYDDDGRAGLLSDDGKTLRLGESVVTFTRPCPDCFDGLIRSQDDLRPHRRCGGSGRVPGEGDGR